VKSFIYIVIVLFAKVGLAQRDSVEIFSDPQISPECLGGVKAQIKFIKDNFIYPTIAQEKGISGKCYVSFVIDTIGQTKNVIVVKGIKDCTQCDDEAKRLIRLMLRCILDPINVRS
jgi:Gram-negative bacterial TonB protein C-terminal